MPETAVTHPAAPLPHPCPDRLDAFTPVLSLNSQINKLLLSCRKKNPCQTTEAPQQDEDPAGRKAGRADPQHEANRERLTPERSNTLVA